jgi:hypothetical protein
MIGGLRWTEASRMVTPQIAGVNYRKARIPPIFAIIN